MRIGHVEGALGWVGGEVGDVEVETGEGGAEGWVESGEGEGEEEEEEEEEEGGVGGGGGGELHFCGGEMDLVDGLGWVGLCELLSDGE